MKTENMNPVKEILQKYAVGQRPLFDRRVYEMSDFDECAVNKYLSGCGVDFPDAVAACLAARGYTGDVNDRQNVIAEVKRLFESRLGEKCPAAVINWLKGKNTSDVNRLNNYKLCFALGLDLKDTADFFLNNYLTLPFNYKNSTDAIFFYGFYRQKDYAVISAMLEKAESFPVKTLAATGTSEIGRRILQIDDDDEFLDYISAHCFVRNQQYMKCREEIVSLIDKYSGGNISAFFSELTGVNYQRLKREKVQRRKTLPRELCTSLPTDGTLDAIKKGQQAETYETLRKTLILLYFYDYFKCAPDYGTDGYPEKQAEEFLKDFYSNMNEELNRCGLCPLYYSHPFDCAILMCAMNKAPLNVFGSIYELIFDEI